MRYQTLIFDLDGTISDPFIGISRSINYALEARGYRPVDPESVRALIGPPLTDIFRHLLGPLSDAEINGLIDKYRERYAEVGYAENRIYDQIPGAIARLAECGYTLGVCTSKREEYAVRIVEMFGLTPYFSFIDGGAGIPKGTQIGAMVAGGLTATTAIMIGDRAADVLAAKSNGMASAGVLWGFGERAELEGAAPDYIFGTPDELAGSLLP